MFKTFADFAAVHGTPAHPGQPVYHGRGYAVWRDHKHFLLGADGKRHEFDSQAEAEAHAERALSAPVHQAE